MMYVEKIFDGKKQKQSIIKKQIIKKTNIAVGT